jgi:hypothetical protein
MLMEHPARAGFFVWICILVYLSEMFIFKKMIVHARPLTHR